MFCDKSSQTHNSGENSVVKALPALAFTLLSWTLFSTELSLVPTLGVNCWKSLLVPTLGVNCWKSLGKQGKVFKGCSCYS